MKIVYKHGRYYKEKSLSSYDGRECPKGLVELRPLNWFENLLIFILQENV